jgi:hypothetical protein
MLNFSIYRKKSTMFNSYNFRTHVFLIVTKISQIKQIILSTKKKKKDFFDQK